jgi:tRNA nucleotidyltransferase (CCA-adding enzyme)
METGFCGRDILEKTRHPENLDGLWLVMAADHMGRPPLPQIVPSTVTELRDRAKNLGVHQKPPEAFLMGRDLITMGMKPGKEMGEILKRAYEAQLDGEIISKESALEWLDRGAPNE